MKYLMKLISSIFKPLIKCNHKKNYWWRKWLDKDRTPMIDFFCYDCGYKDRGHVHGDSSGWPEDQEYDSMKNKK